MTTLDQLFQWCTAILYQIKEQRVKTTSLLVALTKLSQAENTWRLARIQNVLQVFPPKWERSWTATLTRLHLEKETRHSYKFIFAPKVIFVAHFWRIEEEKDGLRSCFYCCLKHPAPLVTAEMKTRRTEKRGQHSLLTAASSLLKSASFLRRGFPRAMSSLYLESG